MKFLDLVKKYNVAGPRYTSYPTVPYWSDTPSSEQWAQSVKEALSQYGSAAFYVHIPFCESLCTYCGCNTRITRNHAVSNPYIETLFKELDLYRQKLELDKIPASDLHLGGGTPTFLSVSELKTLLTGLLSRMDVKKEAEFSIEADPRVTSKEQLELLFEFGFRRLSLGIQDFDSKVQEAVHRVQSVEQVRELTEAARKIGFLSINYDLIYGLPFQTSETMAQTLEKVSVLRPDRIAFYSYAHVPWIKPSQRRFTEADLPQGLEKLQLYELGRNVFEASGYKEIGMDHFALESEALWKATVEGKLHRNFMGYTTQKIFPLIGLGVSAIGDSGNAFIQNEKLLETYQNRILADELPIARGHMLSLQDLVLKNHILNLMTKMRTQWGLDEMKEPYIKEALKKLEEPARDGLVILGRDFCQITDLGKSFLRNICMAFDAKLSAKEPESKVFSQTV